MFTFRERESLEANKLLYYRGGRKAILLHAILVLFFRASNKNELLFVCVSKSLPSDRYPDSWQTPALHAILY